jgi:hypothetical protein
MVTDNCSMWLTSGVQSAVIEKYFACKAVSTMFYFTLFASKFINSFCIIFPQ